MKTKCPSCYAIIYGKSTTCDKCGASLKSAGKKTTPEMQAFEGFISKEDQQTQTNRFLLEQKTRYPENYERAKSFVECYRNDHAAYITLHKDMINDILLKIKNKIIKK